MDHKTFFMDHWDKEAAATRKVISRIPQSHADYKPDPKARSARDLAWMIVYEEVALGDGLKKGALEWADVQAPATIDEIVQTYDREHARVTRGMREIDAAAWDAQVPFLYGGKEVMKDTAYEMAWGFLLDQIHHRGQLSTYLRPMGAKVPAIYGPSADEAQ
jgi:uncharacterized damage-inducible protein DinB